MQSVAHAELEGDRCGISLEKSKATHPSVLAWEIPWTEEPGGLESKSQTRLSD